MNNEKEEWTKALPPMMCIYHRGCLDGIGAAWVVHKAYEHRDIEYYGGQYNEEIPDVSGKEVIIVDFSYKAVDLQEMAKVAYSIVVIDHHKTAEAELSQPIEGVQTIFDMGHSGAVLTWMQYFGKNDPNLPQALIRIQDRDLWKFEYEDTKDFCAALFSYDRSNLNEMFEILSACEYEEYVMPDYIREGKALNRDHDNRLKAAAKNARIGGCKGIEVPWVNAPPDLASDLGHMLSKDYPFAVIYWDTKDKTIYSLRSNEDGQDVSEIAKFYGGGGHKHAAGFTKEREQ